MPPVAKRQRKANSDASRPEEDVMTPRQGERARRTPVKDGEEHAGGLAEGWAVNESGTVLWKNFGDVKGSKKVGLFDLDGTIIDTKGGQTFAKNRQDWKYHLSNVASRLRKMVNDEETKFVIVTNQLGIKKGTQIKEDIMGKIDDIFADLRICGQAFVLADEDVYRKPAPGLWNFFLNDHNDDVSVDLSSSFFVGDAAGRPAVGKRKKDHSAADLKFALNVGLPFKTPENFFRGESLADVPKTFAFDPRTIGSQKSTAGAASNKDSSKEDEASSPSASNASSSTSTAAPSSSSEICEPSEARKETRPLEVVVMVGPPGSGKTWYSRKMYPGHTHINQDTLKSKEKCIAACRQSLARGASCVIDNTNSGKAVRGAYVQAAKSAGASARCVVMDVPKDFCFHLDAYRKINPRSREHRDKKVPAMVIHSFFKNKEEPTTDEGFESVETIGFGDVEAGPFEHPQDERLFKSFLV